MSEIVVNENITQRELSRKLGISVSTVNALVNKMIKEGFIKMTQVSQKQVFYMLTPVGMMEKAKKTVSYLKAHYRTIYEMKEKIKLVLNELTQEHDAIFILMSDDEIDEMLSIAVKEYQSNHSKSNIKIVDHKNKKEIKQFMISLNSFNFESLAYDEINNNFLVISKDGVLNKPESKRIVYQFTINNPNETSMVFEVDILKINEIISASLTNLGSSDVLFNPSEIAIHPITREIYILSASDRILTIYNNRGLKSVFPLPAELYYKPEGLAFFKNGDLLISSEGDKRGIVKGNIMLFKYKK